MRWLILILFVLPIIEIGVFVWIGGYIGPWSVMFLIILTGLFGIVLAKHQGVETWKKAQETMEQGHVPTEQIIDGLCILLGSIFLVTPGFITDVFGIVLIIPFLRYPLKVQVIKFLKNIVQRRTI